MIISVMTIILFITPNYAEGYYESSWVLVETDSANNYNAAVVDKNGDGWIFGDNGEIVHGVNLEQWTQINSPTIENLTTAYQNDDLIVAAGNNGVVLYKQYDTDIWTQTIIPEIHVINAVSINSNNEIYTVGDTGEIWCFKDQNWVEVQLGIGENLLDIVFEGERGLISGTSGLILGSEDNGETWEIRETPEQVSESEIISIGYYGINRGYAITSDGQILKSTQEALTTTVGYYWNLKEIESENMSTSLDVSLTSVEILSSTKILLAGENGYIALSKDGGNIVTPQLLPIDKDFRINDIAMKTAFVGIIVGDEGNIMYTENGGEDEAVGFEIIDLSDFSEFVDFTKDNLLEGLKATVKIVVFGILLGFFIGIALAMCKTAPTTLKQMIEGDLERTLLLFWGIVPVTLFACRTYGNSSGVTAFLGLLLLTSLINYYINKNLTVSEGFMGISIPDKYRKNTIRLIGLSLLIGLPLNGVWEIKGGLICIYSGLSDFHTFQLGSETLKLSAQIGYIFAPIGNPSAFFRLILGIGMTYLGVLFLITNGSFSKKNLYYGRPMLAILLWLFILTEVVIDSNISSEAVKSWFNFLDVFGWRILMIFLGVLLTRRIFPNGLVKKANYSEEYKISIDPWKLRPLQTIATLYTDFFRNTPLLVQFMFIHFGLQLGKHIQNIGIDLTEDLIAISSYLGPLENIFDPMINYVSESLFGPGKRSYLSAIFALGLNSAAYQCETIRGAIAAIPSGQMEAGRSIGLTYMGTMRLIILPQAIRICIPPLGNEMVNLVLNSSLASVIAYTELTRQGKLVVAITFQIFWTWGMVMVAYFVVTWSLALLLRRLEEKTRIPGLGISGGN
jgi:polar amino acid transport system permease protein